MPGEGRAPGESLEPGLDASQEGAALGGALQASFNFCNSHSISLALSPVRLREGVRASLPGRTCVRGAVSRAKARVAAGCWPLHGLVPGGKRGARYSQLHPRCNKDHLYPALGAEGHNHTRMPPIKMVPDGPSEPSGSNRVEILLAN